MKKILCILLSLILISALFCSCGKTESEEETESLYEHTLVKFTMEGGDYFIVELYPEYAPATCENFIKLVEEGFYEGLVFHRVVDEFMAQGGCYDKDGNAHEADTIKGEFSSNGFTQNTLSHTDGVISMARSSEPDSASSQFFICYGDQNFLDGSYAAFGKVIEGMETVEAFCNVERTYNGMDSSPASPVEPIVIDYAEVLYDATEATASQATEAN